MTPRKEVRRLSEIPNVGPATIRCLALLEITEPFELVGRDPYALYRELCERAGKTFDPCLADVLISAVRYMEGAPARSWWYYTPERKRMLPGNRSLR